ncbi:precorrin-3B C(17)-methyltransferase [Roseospira visakhapatnamensis]|uniref:Cobalt-precorrin 5A hydrolase/precorrin-3B C17-methyltransferase n=1 Tax=Roseospira visakhapatnamensis TaxID=390880 RepID=A0A7W6RFS4_9PROT|nr:precorrin-3B C(17)-methyltransferase [Roseospira visakhapatnamensis]MBB4267209.1 cobalt-precorrin 5A hydrolase/precorrin-3B C17-methyltransferase [Roseospira visakhapatnamensis]
MTRKASPVFVVLNQTGLNTARRVAEALPGAEVHGLTGRVRGADAVFTGTSSHLRSVFRSGRAVVGVCATGIIIRALAPFLADKWAEPPVLALAADGSAVVPLLGGHHGANELAARIAQALGLRASITTAGDVAGGTALDALPDGWRLATPDAVRGVMAALIDGHPVTLDIGDLDPALSDWLTEDNDGFQVPSPDAAGQEGDPGTGPRVRVSDRADIDTRGETVVLRPPTLAVGVGCERGCAPGEVENLVRESLAHAGLSPQSVACVVSLDLKADEPAVLALGEALETPVRFLDAATLERETPRLATPSEAVFREVGCHGVAEGAALAAAGPDGVLVQPKRKSLRATCAIARSVTGIRADRVGQARGRLWVVGIGPGAAGWRTPEASAAVAAATDLVGYRLYLDLLGEARVGKARHATELGAESERVTIALNLAARGRDVVLVSSGDAGIYALASLVFETLERMPDRADWRRVEIGVCPGVSAMQAAAARVGAPLGHDFCAISLSDLLTPRAVIERRVRAAAEGDFVIALYNPMSKRRRDLLPWARAHLLAHRPADTPVIVARDLGRAGESVCVTTLTDLDPEAVDMLTLVLVGASETRRFEDWVYTPRGYGSGAVDDAMPALSGSADGREDPGS